MLEKMLFPKSHIFEAGLKRQQVFLRRHEERVDVEVLVRNDLTPQRNSAGEDLVFNHFLVAVIDKIPIQIRIGLFSDLFDQSVVELELGGELVHYLGHAVQKLEKNLRSVLIFRVVYSLSQSLCELVPEVNPVFIDRHYEPFDCTGVGI